MSRYIDADFAQLIADKELDNYDKGIVYWVLAHTPNADVQEVKHGKWIEDGYENAPCVCSCCGAESQYVSKFNETFDYDWEENLQPTGYEEIREYIKTPYCSQCGAKMGLED